MNMLWCGLVCLLIGLVFGVIIGFVWGEESEREKTPSKEQMLEEFRLAMMHDYE